MTTSPLQAAMRRVLNDRRIFWMPQELVAKARWAEFRDALNRNQKTGAMAVLEAAEQAVTTRIRNERDAQSRKHLEDGRTLLMNLGSSLATSRSTRQFWPTEGEPS